MCTLIEKYNVKCYITLYKLIEKGGLK